MIFSASPCFQKNLSASEEEDYREFSGPNALAYRTMLWKVHVLERAEEEANTTVQAATVVGGDALLAAEAVLVAAKAARRVASHQHMLMFFKL